MRALFWLLFVMLQVIDRQALAQGPGYPGRAAEGLQGNHEDPSRQQELQLHEKPTPAQMRQMELENRLRILKMEIDKKSRLGGLSGSVTQGEPVTPRQPETPSGDKRDPQDESPTCVNEPAGRAFLECLDRIAPKH